MNVPTVTFDVYSALIDSRRGGSAALAALDREVRLGADAEELFIAWDRRNKQLHQETTDFVSFRFLAHRAMHEVAPPLGLRVDPDRAADHLLRSMASWPRWADVDDGVRAVARQHPVALVSNIDDDLLAATGVCRWVTERLTSAQVRVYKPHAALYDAARRRFGDDLVHVPASARDTRGSLDAGLRVVRVRRPGHVLDADGPTPDHEVDDLGDLPDALTAAGFTS